MIRCNTAIWPRRWSQRNVGNMRKMSACMSGCSNGQLASRAKKGLTPGGGNPEWPDQAVLGSFSWCSCLLVQPARQLLQKASSRCASEGLEKPDIQGPSLMHTAGQQGYQHSQSSCIEGCDWQHFSCRWLHMMQCLRPLKSIALPDGVHLLTRAKQEREVAQAGNPVGRMVIELRIIVRIWQNIAQGLVSVQCCDHLSVLPFSEQHGRRP